MISSPRVARAIGLAVVVAVAGVLGGCSGGSGAVGGNNYVAGDGTITVLSAEKRGAPVELRGTTLEGKPFDVTALRGRVLVINVWGSWCAPCRAEAPDLQAAYLALAPQGVEFLGINTKEQDPAQARAFQRTFGITYPSLVDDGGQALLALRGAVAPNAIPSTLVIDEQGRVAARISSGTTKVTLVDVVDDVRGAGRTP